MEVIIKPDAKAVSKGAARFFERQVVTKPASVLGFAASDALLPLYRELVTMNEAELIEFARVNTFNLDEYVGLAPDHPRSIRAFLRKHLFAHIDIAPESTHAPDGTARNVPVHCEQYENAIRLAGGFDLLLPGIGADGQIGFNEPSSSLNSRTLVRSLTPQAIGERAQLFGSEAAVPRHVITIGICTTMEARQVLVLAVGPVMARVVAAIVEGPVTADVPASILQMHPRCVLIVDESAATQLRRVDYHRWVYDQKPEWQRV